MTAQDEADHRRSGVIATAALVAAHLCVTVPLAIVLSIWIDEAYSLAASKGDLSFVLRQTRDVEMQPPFYFVLLWAWRLVDPSIPFARMLSVIAAAAALVASSFAARRWVRGISPAWIVCPLAFNTYMLYAATEIRPYSLVVLWTALLLIFFHDGFFAGEPRRGARWLYAATALAALATYYYLGFVLVACATALLVERRWRVLGSYVIWMSAVGLLFLPLFLHTSGHIESAGIDAVPGPGPLRAAEFVVARVAAFPFALFSLPSILRLAVLALVLSASGAALWIHRRRTTPQARAIWVITAVISGFYGLVVMFVMAEEIQLRHMIVALVPAVFSIVSVVALLTRHRRFALMAWASAAIGLTGVASIQQFKHLAKGGDFKRVARYLEANEKPGQSIAVIVANAEAPLSYYYHGSSTLIAIPQHDDLSRFDPAKWILQSEDQIREKLDAGLSSDGEVWLFTDFIPGTTYRTLGMDLHFPFIETVLAAHYEIISRRDFYASSVRLLRRRPAAPAGEAG